MLALTSWMMEDTRREGGGGGGPERLQETHGDSLTQREWPVDPQFPKNPRGRFRRIIVITKDTPPLLPPTLCRGGPVPLSLNAD